MSNPKYKSSRNDSNDREHELKSWNTLSKNRFNNVLKAMDNYMVVVLPGWGPVRYI